MPHTLEPPLVLPAPAKLNLFLHITGRRPDGYHTLQTVFQLLDYGDELRFTVRTDGVIHVHPEMPGVPAEHNLVMRAARLLQQHTGCSLGADIELIKRLPAGGGLGGGSSDAATALVGLNNLWRTGLEQAELAELGLRLGADVPVFIHGKSAWAEGIGEALEPLTLSTDWYCVICPCCAVSTAEIFQHPDLTRNTPPITIRAFLEGAGHNDCQPVVERLFPPVKQALHWLSQNASSGMIGTGRMTGTGACVFARFEHEHDARQVLNHLPSMYQGFVACGINNSPLHQQPENVAKS